MYCNYIILYNIICNRFTKNSKLIFFINIIILIYYNIYYNILNIR